MVSLYSEWAASQPRAAPSAPSAAHPVGRCSQRPRLPTMPPPRVLRLWAVPGGALVLGLRVPGTAFCFTGGSVASAGGSCAPARQEDAGVQRMRAHGPLRILTKLRSESERVSSFRGQQGGPEYETERTHVSPGGEGALLRHCGAESTVTSGPGQGGRQKVRASRRNGVKGHKTDH